MKFLNLLRATKFLKLVVFVQYERALKNLAMNNEYALQPFTLKAFIDLYIAVLKVVCIWMVIFTLNK